MEIIKEVLPSGLTVILAPMEGCKSVTEAFVTRTGWRYEDPEIAGISHFSEHLFLRGTEKRPTKKAINDEITSRGGIINANTNEEHTYYWIKISGRFLDMAHDMLSDMLFNSRFAPKHIAIEGGAILEELHALQDDPEKFLFEVLWPKLLYGEQPAGECGIGNEKSITGLKRSQFLDYVRSLYVGPNSGVIAAGKIESPSKTINDLNHYFGKINSDGPKIKMSPVMEKQRKPRIVFVYKKTSQTHVGLGVRANDVFHPDQYAQKVLGIILGGNMGSRMFTELREKRGLAYSIDSESRFGTDHGSLLTTAGLNSEKINEALKLMIEQYRKVAEKKIPEKELRGAKDFIIGNIEMALEGSDTITEVLAEQFALSNKIEGPEEMVKKYEAVTAKDIQRVAQNIFRNERLNLAIVGPHRQIEEKIYPILRF